MNLDDYLIEQKIKQVGIEEFFKSFLPQVFTKKFLKRIEKYTRDIKFREIVNDNEHLASYTNSFGTIFLNKPVFYQLSKTEQTSIVLHELIHILQFRKVSEMNSLSKNVWLLYTNKKKKEAQISQVVIGKAGIKPKFINRNEVVPYLMNEKIRWEFLEDGAREELLEILKKSGVFQVDTPFWQERLK